MDKSTKKAKGRYEKPATKRHQSMNVVQGSGLYYVTLYYYY